MGNYKHIETEFIERTLRILDQYDEAKKNYDEPERYDHTLFLNCLFGLLVLPKEIHKEYLANDRITALQTEWGMSKESTFNEKYKTIRDMIHRLRNAVAHFGIECFSNDEKNLIDRIEFTDRQAGEWVATFVSEDLFHFVRSYADYLLKNLASHNK